MSLEFLSNIQNIGTNAVGALERFLDNGNGISRLRGIDWDRSYLWIVEFEKDGSEPPAPFNDWFPAASATLNSISSSGEEFVFGQSKLYIPTSNDTAPTLSITFYDDVNRSLYKWIHDWMNVDIHNGGHFTSGLLDDHQVVVPPQIGSVIRNVQPVRTINLIYLNLDRSTFQTKRYAIVPSGDLTRDLSQASQAIEYSVNFHIVGEQKSTSGSADTSITNKIKDILGRVI